MAQRTTAPVKRRRTQAERSAATKERLLTATVDSLYELGYSRTTTYSVEQRAGVTRGALLHHFSSKIALFIAAVEFMVDTVERQLAADAATATGETKGEDAVDLLWRQFTSPTFAAFTEIAGAARTDPVLRDALVEHQKRLDARCRAAAAELLGAPVDDADFDMGLELTIRYMRGAATMAMPSESSGTTGEGHDEVYQDLRRIVAPYVAGAVGTRRTDTRRG